MLRFHHRIDPNKPEIELIEIKEVEEEKVIPLPESNYVDLSIDEKDLGFPKSFLNQPTEKKL